MYKQKSPHIFKITLPDGVMDSETRVNSYFDKTLGRIVIPEEQPLNSGLGDDDNNPDESKSEASYIELV